MQTEADSNTNRVQRTHAGAISSFVSAEEMSEDLLPSKSRC
jgi:hypothetical protein